MNTRHLRPEQLRGLSWRGLVRESSAAQAEKWSPDRQKADIERAAGELGLLPAAEPRWYEAVGSGEDPSHLLAPALADARAGSYDVLMVLTTSRFARNRSEAVRMKAEFARTGTVIYFVAERIVSGARQTALLEGVKEVVDAEENEVRRMWIAGGHRERFLAGRWNGAIPVGYRKALTDRPDGTRGWDGALEPSEDSQTVRLIYDRFASGVEPREIAFYLNAEGVRSARGPWSRAQAVKVLRNPVYAGRLLRYRHHRAGHYYPESDEHDGRREMDAPWEPLVDPVLWDQVQKLLDHRAPGGKPGGKRRYPLSTILRCAKCGHRMTGVRGGNSRRYYRCSKRAAEGTCDAPAIRASDAEATFARWLGSIRLPEDWREAIARTDAPEASEPARAKLEARLTRLRNLYSWGELTDGQYRAEAAEVRHQIALLARPAPRSIEQVAEALTRLGPGWLRQSSDAQARTAELIVRQGIVEDSELFALIVRSELKPLVELCVEPRYRLSADERDYTADIIRWSFG